MLNKDCKLCQYDDKVLDGDWSKENLDKIENQLKMGKARNIQDSMFQWLPICKKCKLDIIERDFKQLEFIFNKLKVELKIYAANDEREISEYSKDLHKAQSNQLYLK